MGITVDVKKVIFADEQLKVKGATLLTGYEAKQFLTAEDRVYHDSWLLRSPDQNGEPFVAVFPNGDLFKAEKVSDWGHCLGAVRPVLMLEDLHYSRFKPGDMFVYAGLPFIIISMQLALCLDDLGLATYDGSNYESAEVKKLVDNWFESTLE
jgi:hypothetical protein